MSVQVNSAIEYIPLSGTSVGKSVSGDIELNELVKLKNIITNNQREIFFTDDGYIVISNQNFDTGFTQNFQIGSGECNIFTTDGFDYTSTRNDINGLNISGSNSLARGIIGQQDFSPNITELDYTQKIYVDTKASKLGADDIEVTDFNKGVILTSPNGSRYRITVDNSGVLTTTIIP